MCGCALKPSFAATPSRATILRQPAVVKGEPRSPAAHSGLKPSVSSTIQAAAVFAMVDPVEAQEHGHAAGLCPWCCLAQLLLIFVGIDLKPHQGTEWSGFRLLLEFLFALESS
jgi:hypothetical protein